MSSAEHRQESPRRSRERRYDLVTVLLLVAGGLVLFLGWVVGVALLWAGPRWTTREKLLGTLVWPLGPGGVLLASLLPTTTTVCSQGAADAQQRCTTSGWSLPSSLGVPVLAVVTVSGVAVAVFLLARARRPDRAQGATT